MVLLKKLFFSEIENILKVLWWILSITVIIVTIVLLSIFMQRASNLRSWRNETNDYVPIVSFLNTDTYLNFLKHMNVSFSNNDIKSNKSNSDVLKNYLTRIADLGDNETDLYDEVTEKRYCKPLPPKDDFSRCGSRVADRKCCEYIWSWKYKDNIMEHTQCVTGGKGIIGGSKVQPGEFPHMVAVGFKRLKAKNNQNQYDFQCGGSLISEEFVLTAGHCTHLGANTEFNKLPTVVAMGGENLARGMEIRKLEIIIKHYKYKPPKHYYDIALLKLLRKVDFTYNIHPACLSTTLVPRYTNLNITGWGTTNPFDTFHMSDHLQVATVNIMDSTVCESAVRNRIRRSLFWGMKPHQICAGKLTEEVDTCQGDSGGPLQVKLNTEYGNIHTVVGVTSFGPSHCGSKKPAIYVKVSSVISWIENIVWPQTKGYLSQSHLTGKVIHLV